MRDSHLLILIIIALINSILSLLAITTALILSLLLLIINLEGSELLLKGGDPGTLGITLILSKQKYKCK